MNICRSLLIVLCLIISSQLIASTKVIYGEDNRQDVYASSNASFVELSKSTAAMINPTNLKSVGSNEVEISGTTLEGRGICKTERFSKQISAANCSGFLVSDTILVTAGHCIKDMNDCKKYKWIFDYKVDSADQGSVTVPSTNVYNCKKIISRALDGVDQDDYAAIELDRNVTDRQPLTFRRSGKIAAGDAIVVIGHPTGLPTKIADGATVRSLQGKFFKANLDTYGGNSGSAVFNVKTQEVEGILVRGETDYVYSSAQGCQISNVCSSMGCRGEDVTFITNIEALKNIH